MMRRSLSRSYVLPLVVVAFGLACGGRDETTTPPTALPAEGGVDGAVPSLTDGGRTPYDAGGSPSVPRVPVHAEMIAPSVDTQGMLFASGEMQISGEPFAQLFAGRNLAYYDRVYLPADQYLVPDPAGKAQPITDLFGFSTAVESYEYSKYHMNSIVQFSGAGVSLANGPLIARLPQATPKDRLIARTGRLMTTAGTNVAGFATLPAPIDNPLNVLGFAGLVPVFAPYTAFDPSVPGTTALVTACTGGAGYGSLPGLVSLTPAYECEYNELHVPDSQLNHVLSPAALGFGVWKQALWAIDFGSPLHDAGGTPVNTVADADRPLVGLPQNVVRATDPPTAVLGTFIGSNPLEGMWGLVMIDAMDNLAEWLLGSLTTTDGATLSGFASTTDAVTYDYDSPLRWFPSKTTVAVDATATFPTVSSLTLTDPTSRSVDLAGLLLGNAMFFAMSDPRNPGVGQRLGLQLLFDGDPFAADDGVANGEATAHDRSLGVVRVSFVDLVRMHADPTLGIVLDTATVSGGVITRGPQVSTASLAHVLVAMRQTVLSLNATVTQYGAADEDPSGDAQGILNPVVVHPPGGGTPAFSSHVRSVFVKNATFVRDVLTTADGHVVNGATVAAGKATVLGTPATLESQAAAARALTEAFLLTGDESFRDRARAVVRHLQGGFYSAPARMYRGVDGGKDEVSMTPERFGWLQSALRESYKVLFVAGDGALDRAVLEDRVARVHKLFMNGWDDLDGDQRVAKDRSECLTARLQSAEQSLTGETGRDLSGKPAADRDNDCVPELGHAKTLSVFAGEVFFHSP